jgi:hypothetical protein
MATCLCKNGHVRTTIFQEKLCEIPKLNFADFWQGNFLLVRLEGKAPLMFSQDIRNLALG